MINGWLLVNKPYGITTYDIIRKLKTYLKVKCKIGHTGTLDPLAQGEVLIGFGYALKLISFIDDKPKKYAFAVRWGEKRESGDLDGQILTQNNVLPSSEDIKKVLKELHGEILQVPPIFSAVKVNGQRAYQIARRGEKVILKERLVNIFSLKHVKRVSTSISLFEVTCSRGTYVRTLAETIAEKLHTLGVVTYIKRLSSFTHKSTDFGNIDNDILNKLLNIDFFISEKQKIQVNEEEKYKLSTGRFISSSVEEGVYLAYCSNAPFAIVECLKKLMYPRKVFS